MAINPNTKRTAHKLPADLQKALTSSKGSLAIWEGLTPLARIEWICWVISPKKVETRKAHIMRVVVELKEDKRRPCCWIGCIHRKDKTVSPSIKGLLASRSKKSRKNKS